MPGTFTFIIMFACIISFNIYSHPVRWITVGIPFL